MATPKTTLTKITVLALCAMSLCSAQAAGPVLAGEEMEDVAQSHGSYYPPSTIPVMRNIPYGNTELQAFDVYLPATGSAPKGVIVMVHGGGWKRGDKASEGVVANKAPYFTSRGYALVSVNYDLIPTAYPVDQAKQVAKALAKVQSMANNWGAPSEKFILMGHSAGANLVSQLAANPLIAYAQGAKPWAGTISLDSAAQNVVTIMERPHVALYDNAFGTDKEYWIKASPTLNVAWIGPSVLMVCSTQRADACLQAKGYRLASIAKKRSASIMQEDLSHGQINSEIGLPGAYTESIQAFIDSVM